MVRLFSPWDSSSLSPQKWVTAASVLCRCYTSHQGVDVLLGDKFLSPRAVGQTLSFNKCQHGWGWFVPSGGFFCSSTGRLGYLWAVNGTSEGKFCSLLRSVCLQYKHRVCRCKGVAFSFHLEPQLSIVSWFLSKNRIHRRERMKI